jgi:predicted ATPase
MQTLSAEQIARRLDDRFALLDKGSRTGPVHHRTLEAAIDWSYDSLSEREQALFRRLGVFHRRWTLAAATSVCAGGSVATDDVHDLVTSLVDKSLVVVTGARAGEGRTFRLLESVRHYARVKLAGTSDAEMVRDQHLAYVRALAEADVSQPHVEE